MLNVFLKAVIIYAACGFTLDTIYLAAEMVTVMLLFLKNPVNRTRSDVYAIRDYTRRLDVSEILGFCYEMFVAAIFWPKVIYEILRNKTHKQYVTKTIDGKWR